MSTTVKDLWKRHPNVGWGWAKPKRSRRRKRDKGWPDPITDRLALVPTRSEEDVWEEVECLSEISVEQSEQASIMSRLEESADRGNETSFLKTLAEVSWEGKPASEFVRAIKLAFRAGAFAAARYITAKAAEFHSDNAEVQRYVRVLACQGRESTASDVPTSTQANRRWLEEHAGEYSGQWVALRNGELLGAAASLAALVEEVQRNHGVTFPSKEIMLTTGY